MAEVDTMMLAGQHSDIRREAAEHTNEIVKEGLKGDYATQNGIKDSRFDVNSRIGEVARDIDNRFFDVGRDTQDIRAQVIAQQQQVVAGFMGASKDAEINALRTQVELAKQTTYLSDKIDNGNERTVALINRLREDDYGRRLIERNTELVAALDDGRHWHRHADNSQWAALSSQLNAFQSQLQETRQGMVNFGTMAGNAGQQTSTSNNVR